MAWFVHKELSDMSVDPVDVQQSYSFDSLNFIEYSSFKKLKKASVGLLCERAERDVGGMDDKDVNCRSWFKNNEINRSILSSFPDPILLSFPMADRYVEGLNPLLQTERTFNQFNPRILDECSLVLPQIHEVEQASFAEEPLIVLHPGSGRAYK